ncbi:MULTISPECIES: IclR family transcriptional regulator [Rhodobacterales]|jgi:DNA-binding IclR family transcriptional regulator|uniref:IclR family transcriptional regulator n=1 Tax=Rhodobacterales TaxID=204455 RepID=UPI0023043B55|nr:IclR family transcriptional regulator [Lentibacter algarum]WIF32512.1 transcriptional regulator, IclR family [Lentibacter algarum]
MNDQTETAQTDRKFANTLARGLGVLRAFRAGDNGLTHAQIAERTGLPKPTVSRLTYTLAELGYLTHGGRNDRFRLGPAAIALGSVASVAVSFVDAAAEAMQRLADDTGTLALIAVRDGMRMMLVRTWRPADRSTIWLEPGHRIPVFGSSSGLAVMASLDDERFEATTPDDALRQYRRDGYDQLLGRGFVLAPPDTRYARTVNAVSVPYYAGEFGEAVAFTCGALPEDLPDARIMDEVGPALRGVVSGIEHRLGRSPSLTRRG